MNHSHVLVVLLTITSISPIHCQEIYPEIFKAAVSGNLTKLQSLVAQGVDVNVQDEEYHASVLHWVVGKCPKRLRMACIRYLVEEAGADIHALANHQLSAAKLAANAGDFEVEQYLLARERA